MAERARPEIELRDLSDAQTITVVHVNTQAEYDKLTRIFECGGWTWIMGERATTKPELYQRYKEKTYLQAQDGFQYGSMNDDWMKEDYNHDAIVKKRRVISLEQFIKEQRLTPEQIRDIEGHFRDNPQ